MIVIWVLLCSLFILLGVEIRIRILFEGISEWKYGMNRLSEEIKGLKSEIIMLSKDDVKDRHRFEV